MTGQGGEEFVPAVVFADADDARATYFALVEATRNAGSDLSRMVRDPHATEAQKDALATKHERLNRLTGLVFDEWQNLQRQENSI